MTGVLVPGVDEGFLVGTLVHAVVDGDGVVHQPDCEWAPYRAELCTLADLFSAIPCPDCEALQALAEVEPRVDVLWQVVAAQQCAQGATDPSDAIVVRSLLREMEGRASKLSTETVPVALVNAVELALEALGQRMRSLKVHVRTLWPEVLRTCQSIVKTEVPGPWVAFGIQGQAWSISNTKLVDAVIATYGYPVAGRQMVVVVAPQVVRTAIGAIGADCTSGTPVTVDEGRIEAFAEVVATLWEPYKSGPFKSLAAAVEAAQEIVQ